MKLCCPKSGSGFTLIEVVVATAIGTLIFAAIMASMVALQRSFAATDAYFSAHIQQVRIVDYLLRDVKRSTIVHTTSVNSVSCWVPRYIIETGDADAATGVGTRRTPTVVFSPTTGSYNVTYYATTSTNGPLNADGTSETDPTTGQPYQTNKLPISYSISGNQILRTEYPSGGSGNITTIASSTNQLLPSILDFDLVNTECASTQVSFNPSFTMNGSAVSGGTTVYGLAYLRNAREAN